MSKIMHYTDLLKSTESKKELLNEISFFNQYDPPHPKFTHSNNPANTLYSYPLHALKKRLNQFKFLNSC